jgi:hypothetical protein
MGPFLNGKGFFVAKKMPRGSRAIFSGSKVYFTVSWIGCL